MERESPTPAAVDVQVNDDMLESLLVPFYKVCVSCDDTTVFHRCLQAVLSRLLKLCQSSGEGAPAKLSKVNLRSITKGVFGVASNL